MADPVAWLVAELGRVEELARAASDGEGWWLINPRYADHRTIAEYVIEGERGRAVHIDVQEHAPEAHRAEALLIQANNPAAVLRRVKADRQILAEHVQHGADRECARCVVWDEDDEGDLCATPEPWPCRTVRLLAEAWGWPGAAG